MRPLILMPALLLCLAAPAQRGSHVLAGRVRDAEGNPVMGANVLVTDFLAEQGFLSPLYGSNPGSGLGIATRTDAEGRFVIRGAFEVGNHLSVTRFGFKGLDLRPVSIHDPLDLTLELRIRRPEPWPASSRPGNRVIAMTPREAPATAPKLRLEVVDGVTGEPVDDFLVTVFWVAGDRWTIGRIPSNEVFGTRGVVEARGPTDPQITLGIVYASAEGYGRTRRPIEWDPDRRSATIELEPEGILEGVVVDDATGEPVVGASVKAVHNSAGDFGWSGPIRSGNVPWQDVETDAEGRFRLRGLGPGGILLDVEKEGRRDLEQRALEIAAGEKKTGVSLRMPSARAFPGKLSGAPIGDDWLVYLKPQPGMWSYRQLGNIEGAVAVDPEGNFWMEGIYPDTYEAQMILYAAPRQGLFLRVPIEVVQVNAGTERLELDISRVAPGRIRGRVHSPVPYGRLVVLAAPTGTANVKWGYLQYEGPHCAVGLDGRYEIMVPGGECDLVVLDVLTGAMLYRSEETIPVVSSQAMDLDLEAPACRVDVRLRVEGEDLGRSYRVEICPQPESWPEGIGNIAGRPDERSSGMELALGPWQRSSTLYLPEAPTTLRVWADEAQILRTDRHWVLARVEVEPQRDETIDLVIEVPSHR